MRVRGEFVADRAEQHAGEAAVAARAGDHESCLEAHRAQGVGGGVVGQFSIDAQLREVAVQVVGDQSQQPAALLAALLGVLDRLHRQRRAGGQVQCMR